MAAGQAPLAYSHDANGHSTGKTQAGGDSWQYHYSAQERLSRVQKNSVTVAEYRYNAQGQRVQKLAASSTFYLYGQNGLTAEYNAQGELQREYGYAPEAIYTSNPLFMRASNGQLYIYQNDHLGTPQRLIDSSGSVVWQAQYDAFGKAAIQIALVENNLRFPGQYYDSESGLHQNWNRDYDSSTGRYIQRDPIGLKGGMNTYGHALQNSIMGIDPYGLDSISFGFQGSYFVENAGGSGSFTVGADGKGQICFQRQVCARIGVGNSIGGGLGGGRSSGDFTEGNSVSMGFFAEGEKGRLSGGSINGTADGLEDSIDFKSGLGSGAACGG